MLVVDTDDMAKYSVRRSSNHPGLAEEIEEEGEKDQEDSDGP